jgi:hypothetical protein
MTEIDIISVALCAWKENRSHGSDGLQSVINVVQNRVAARKDSSCYAEVYRPFQFSSMSYHNDPEYLLQPVPSDPMWALAISLAVKASTGSLADITQGSTFYYAASIPIVPDWAAKMTATVTVGGQRFFKV